MAERKLDEAAFELRKAAIHLENLASKLSSVDAELPVEELAREVLYDLGNVQEHLCDAWHGLFSRKVSASRSHTIPNWDMQFELEPPQY